MYFVSLSVNCDYTTMALSLFRPMLNHVNLSDIANVQLRIAMLF